MAELEDEVASADGSDERESSENRVENESCARNNETLVSAERQMEASRNLTHVTTPYINLESNTQPTTYVSKEAEESGTFMVNPMCNSSSLSSSNVIDSINVNVNTSLLTSNSNTNSNYNIDGLAKLTGTNGGRINLIISGSQVHEVSDNTKRPSDMLTGLIPDSNGHKSDVIGSHGLTPSDQQHQGKELMSAAEAPTFSSSMSSLTSPTGTDSTVMPSSLFDTPQLQTFLLALQPQLAASQGADASTSATQTIIQNILDQNMLTSLQQGGDHVESHEDNAVGVVTHAQDHGNSQDSGNPLMTLGITSQSNDHVMLSQQVGDSHVHSSEAQLINNDELVNVHGMSNPNILDTLQAEMIAVEVLSQTASGDTPSSQESQQQITSQPHQQSSNADTTNTVNLVQSQNEEGTPMYTLQIGGQTIPFTTIQLPASQASALAQQGAAIQITTSGTVIGGEGANETLSNIDAFSNEPLVTSSATLSSLAGALPPDTPSKTGVVSQPSSESKSKYTCEICGKSYVRSWSYYGHMREHAAGERCHKCEECGKVFSYASNLKQHMLSHSGEKPYACELCDKAFGNPSSLRIHVLSHSEDKPYVCEFEGCDKAFSNPSSLRVHQRVHQTEKPYQCNYQGCALAFKTASELSRHAFRHTGEKPHKCDKCEKSFVRYDDLKRHYFIHTGEKPFRCDQCDFSCIQSFDLVKHRYTHGGDKPYKCEHCPKQFTRPARLRDHMRLHTGEKPFKCDECGKTFTQQTSLKSHKVRRLCSRILGQYKRVSQDVDEQLNHSGDKPFKCDECHKSFTSQNDLKSHMNNHTGLRPFRCDLCGKDFISSKTLRRHAVVHSGDKPFECTECGRKFARASDLKIHLPVHSEDKPYKCDQCEKMFTRYSSLKEHIRTHTGEFPFKCDQCEKIFNHRSHLNTHIRTHTGEKPFKCDICGKEFARKSSLRYHTRVHTEEGGAKQVGRPRKSLLDEDSNDYSSVGSIDSHGLEVEVMDEESEEMNQRPGKRKRDDGSETEDASCSQKRLATDQQVMTSAVEAMRMMANMTSSEDGQLNATTSNQSGLQSSLNESSQVIMQLGPAQIPLVTSQGTAVVTLDLSGLQGTEGQVVETLVQLQGLEAQVANLESLASQAVLNHGQGLTVALDGSVQIPVSDNLIQQMQIQNTDEGISLQVCNDQVSHAIEALSNQAIQTIQQGSGAKQLDNTDGKEPNANNDAVQKVEMIHPRISSGQTIGVAANASGMMEDRVRTETISENAIHTDSTHTSTNSVDTNTQTDPIVLTTAS